MGLLCSVEEEFSQLHAQTDLCAAECAALPPPPPPPKLLEGYPRLESLGPRALLARVALDEVGTVHVVVVPRWRRPPTFSSWGEPTAAPTAAEVLAGTGAHGTRPLASCALPLAAARQVRLPTLEGLHAAPRPRPCPCPCA